ncbi:NAD(P)/FAD-dependent oxidoreductase [Patiriisocius hiemis]|uniref:FAD-binding oxidoreductase n=1 Tax=Patiriisocius hiemis TaxID=3075604 RepID=A0ABU2YG68_9FLAO|nr:FAD-binding oxidoreductase [Constantimarinum sp. W242]MDT0556225.1 FAD-binding oxidoreductase [Constantimarinum sp. W242]
MKKVDYIIVGLGIAGLSLCEALLKANKSFVVIDKGANAATLVSGGVFNPVVLKRFTPAWRGAILLDTAIPFYRSLSKKLQVEIIENTPVYRIFNSIEEQNNWIIASDKKELASYLSTKLLKNGNNAINAPFGFGEVIHSGKINTALLFKSYRSYLNKKDALLTEIFQYQELIHNASNVVYKNIEARQLIFSEGAAAIHNPYFSKEYLIPNKGEYLIIRAPKLQWKSILKGSMFVIPLGDDCYKVGATYERGVSTFEKTEAAKEKILTSLSKMISCPFEVIDQITGIRPTTKDRKPLVGKHNEFKNYYFLNGLGTRGIMGAPWLASTLVDYIENEADLPSEIDISRMN